MWLGNSQKCFLKLFHFLNEFITTNHVDKFLIFNARIHNYQAIKLVADRFKIPVVSFIDTPGAYPGLGAEQRGQASAIANSIECCMSLTVPNISIIIGEGGSGGAIALASSNKVIMLENSIGIIFNASLGCLEECNLVL